MTDLDERRWTLEFVAGYGWKVRGPNIDNRGSIEVVPASALKNEKDNREAEVGKKKDISDRYGALCRAVLDEAEAIADCDVVNGVGLAQRLREAVEAPSSLRQKVDQARFPTSFLRALRDHFRQTGDEQTEDWIALRKDERKLLEAFVLRMARELAANMHKGDRPGWLRAGSREMVSEVLYHAAKLSYAIRQFEQGDGDPDKVREFAADVANCALMAADCTGALEARS